MIRVLYISTDCIQSGAGLCMMQQICHGKERQIEYECVFPWNGNLEEVAEREKIPYCVIRSYPWLRNSDEKNDWKFKLKWKVKSILNFNAEWKIYKLIKEKNIDIVHINTLCSGVGAFAAHIAQVPIVWHFREFVEEDHGSHYINKRRSFRIISQSSAMIAVSDAVKKKYGNYFGSGRIHRIYDGVDIGKFYHPEKVILQEEKVQVLMSGNISHSKGQWQLLKAVVAMNENEKKKIHIKLAGNGNEGEVKKIKDYIKKNHLGNVIEMLGFREDIAELWKQTDIAVVCSRSEAFGRVTVEAMLSGCFVIGADRGATPELIEDGVTGYLFPYGETEALKQKILEAAENREQAQSIAQTGREYAKKYFDSEINARKIENIYKRIYEKINISKGKI